MDFTTNSKIGELLGALSDVRETGQGKWQARCPAHDDNRASLSVSILDDGTIRVWTLHDGRATTLVEAILFHGGDAAASREAFLKLDPLEQSDLLRFLENLVLYKI